MRAHFGHTPHEARARGGRESSRWTANPRRERAGAHVPLSHGASVAVAADQNAYRSLAGVGAKHLTAQFAAIEGDLAACCFCDY